MSGGPSILVARDSFKGTMSAAVVAEAVAAGVRNAGGNVDLCPVADGGEGTLEALRGAVGGHLVRRLATGPDGQRVEACYLLSRDGDSAVIETAAASGLHLVDPERVDAWAATSAGTGELLSAAASAGARHLLLGVGGSGCTDGGLGALSAIAEAGGLHRARLTVLCDVVTPYEEAARVFGPQKGADENTVVRLTTRLHDTAAALPRDPCGHARTGAAGGLAGALWAAYDADLVSGIDTILGWHDVRRRLDQVDAVITGEGRIDAQSAQGKVVEGVARWSADAGVPVYAFVGRNRADQHTLSALGIVAVVEAGDPASLRAAGAVITQQAGQRPVRAARTAAIARSAKAAPHV